MNERETGQPNRFEHYLVATDAQGRPVKLGEGAMGVTYLAEDTNLRVKVALKVIRQNLLGDEEVAQRFQREAQAAARLRHANVAAVYHLGTMDNSFFYAMEFVEGETVKDRVQRLGPLPLKEALEVTLQVCEALGAAEKHKMVHRDIKPANIMIEPVEDEMPRVKLIDFGLAKALHADVQNSMALQTQAGIFLGTPVFASPEQVQDVPLDSRSDFYSLGLTLWFMLEARTPFEGSLHKVLFDQVHTVPPLGRLLWIPGEVRDLLGKMLEKEPANRPQTAKELRQKIHDCLRALSTAGTSYTEWQQRFQVGGLPPRNQPWGMIYEGQDTLSGAVRLHLLRNDRFTDAKAVQNVIADARRAIDIHHPNILRHLTVFPTSGAQGAGWMVVTEHPGTQTLLDHLRKVKQIPPDEVASLMERLASAIDTCIASDLMTADLDPAGIFLKQVPGTEILAITEVGSQTHTAVVSHAAEKYEVVPKLSPINYSYLSTLQPAEETAIGVTRGAFRPEPQTPQELVQRLAILAYQCMGGSTPSTWARTPRFIPLACLSQRQNESIRAAITDSTWTRAVDFVESFQQLSRTSSRKVAADGSTTSSTHSGTAVGTSGTTEATVKLTSWAMLAGLAAQDTSELEGGDGEVVTGRIEKKEGAPAKPEDVDDSGSLADEASPTPLPPSEPTQTWAQVDSGTEPPAGMKPTGTAPPPLPAYVEAPPDESDTGSGEDSPVEAPVEGDSLAEERSSDLDAETESARDPGHSDVPPPAHAGAVPPPLPVLSVPPAASGSGVVEPGEMAIPPPPSAEETEGAAQTAALETSAASVEVPTTVTDMSGTGGPASAPEEISSHEFEIEPESADHYEGDIPPEALHEEPATAERGPVAEEPVVFAAPEAGLDPAPVMPVTQSPPPPAVQTSLVPVPLASMSAASGASAALPVPPASLPGSHSTTAQAQAPLPATQGGVQGLPPTPPISKADPPVAKKPAPSPGGLPQTLRDKAATLPKWVLPAAAALVVLIIVGGIIALSGGGEKGGGGDIVDKPVEKEKEVVVPPPPTVDALLTTATAAAKQNDLPQLEATWEELRTRFPNRAWESSPASESFRGAVVSAYREKKLGDSVKAVRRFHDVFLSAAMARIPDLALLRQVAGDLGAEADASLAVPFEKAWLNTVANDPAKKKERLDDALALSSKRPGGEVATVARRILSKELEESVDFIEQNPRDTSQTEALKNALTALMPRMKQIADAGVPEAYYILGDDAAKSGRLVAAMDFFEKAASLGHPQSMRRYGNALTNVFPGHLPDWVSAAYWLKLAAKANDVKACVFLADIYLPEEPSPERPREPVEAKRLLETAIKEQLPEAHLIYGNELLRQNHNGNPPDFATELTGRERGVGAIEHLKKAVEAGIPNAYSALAAAMLSVADSNGKKDIAGAVKILEDGSNLPSPDPRCLLNLAALYNPQSGGLPVSGPDLVQAGIYANLARSNRYLEKAKAIYIEAAKRNKLDAVRWCEENNVPYN